MDKIALSAAEISRISSQVFAVCDRAGIPPYAYDSIPVLLQKDSDNRLRIAVEVSYGVRKGKREQ